MTKADLIDALANEYELSKREAGEIVAFMLESIMSTLVPWLRDRSPELGDLNEDLRTLGIDALRAEARLQLAPHDVARFMALAA